VYAPGYVIFCVILALVPQIIIALKLQPMLVKNYCYMAAITMGIDKPDDNEHHDGDGESHPSHGGAHGGGGAHDEHHHHGMLFYLLFLNNLLLVKYVVHVLTFIEN